MESGETVSSTVSDPEFSIRACALRAGAGRVRTLCPYAHVRAYFYG
jgi:hypothetical protein